jgi:hypothetical protein
MADIQNSQAELELKRQQMLLEDDRARDKQESELMLRAYEVQLKYGTQLDMDAIRQMADRSRVASPSVQQPVVPEIVPFDMQQMQPPMRDMQQMQPPMGAGGAIPPQPPPFV